MKAQYRADKTRLDNVSPMSPLLPTQPKRNVLAVHARKPFALKCTANASHQVRNVVRIAAALAARTLLNLGKK